MSTQRARAFALVGLLYIPTTCGCAAWISTQSEVGVATSPHASVTQVADLGGAFGSGGHRFYMTVGGGTGYRIGRETPYGVVHSEAGYEWGTDLRASFALTGRGLFGDHSTISSPKDPIKLETAGDEAGGGVAGALLAKLPGADQGSGGKVFVGARASLEVGGGQTAQGSERLYFLGTIGPILRWAITDSTEGRSPL